MRTACANDGFERGLLRHWQRLLRCLCMLLLPAVMNTAQAGPWLEAGDVRARHDLLLLADSGVIDGPVSTWPLVWENVYSGLGGAVAGRTMMLSDAARRLSDDYVRAIPLSGSQVRLRVSITDQPLELRGFEQTPRTEHEFELGVEGTGESLFYRARVTAAPDALDGKDLRGDGSYVGGFAGNWMLSAGLLDRWWGPGWDTSLILSSNARPIPAVALNRKVTEAFEWPVLRWLGPWQFTVLMGELESNVAVPNAQFFGMRLNFKPLQSLEIGLSRTAQWGGDGRPQGLGAFMDMLLGNDNAGDSGINTDQSNEPGNQLAGFDVRWVSPLFDLPYAVYVQGVGDDESGGMPSKYIGMVGAEIWGARQATGLGYRVYLEYSDTATDGWRGEPQYDIAYQHGIYTDGYTYRGRSIGSSMGGDGRMGSIGVMLIEPNGNSWGFSLRDTQLDRDSPNGTDEIALLGGYRWRWRGNAMWAGAGVAREDPRSAGDISTRAHFGLQLQRDL